MAKRTRLVAYPPSHLSPAGAQHRLHDTAGRLVPARDDGGFDITDHEMHSGQMVGQAWTIKEVEEDDDGEDSKANE
jgi:hypothetical protein